MLLRNIDQVNGLCNETRLQVSQSIDLVLCDSKFSFKCSKQFSISLYFATMVNKNQGQSLSKVGLYQSQPMITHGQLYVVVSKVTTKI